MIRKIASDRCYPESVYKRRRLNRQLENLPEDVLGTILAKLPVNEVVRTSVLSTEWRYFVLAVCLGNNDNTPKSSLTTLTQSCYSTMGWWRNLQSNSNSTPC